MQHYISKEVDVDGLGYVEGVVFNLEVTTELNHLEPYSWGESRGTEVVVTDINLTSVEVGKLTLKPSQADLMFGDEAIQRVLDAIDLDDLL